MYARLELQSVACPQPCVVDLAVFEHTGDRSGCPGDRIAELPFKSSVTRAILHHHDNPPLPPPYGYSWQSLVPERESLACRTSDEKDWHNLVT